MWLHKCTVDALKQVSDIRLNKNMWMSFCQMTFTIGEFKYLWFGLKSFESVIAYNLYSHCSASGTISKLLQISLSEFSLHSLLLWPCCNHNNDCHPHHIVIVVIVVLLILLKIRCWRLTPVTHPNGQLSVKAQLATKKLGHRIHGLVFKCHGSKLEFPKLTWFPVLHPQDGIGRPSGPVGNWNN